MGSEWKGGEVEEGRWGGGMKGRGKCCRHRAGMHLSESCSATVERETFCECWNSALSLPVLCSRHGGRLQELAVVLETRGTGGWREESWGEGGGGAGRTWATQCWFA